MQAKHHAFLKGFLPPFANAALVGHLVYLEFRILKLILQDAAKLYGTLNRLHTPDYSTFATYAYAAGPHLDSDVAPSSGWVIKRASKVGSTKH